ncbi:MAG: hypothetical protein ABR981_02730 [Candidatus Micrarchaeaceae archaeon]|jgi:hypothetical protein
MPRNIVLEGLTTSPFNTEIQTRLDMDVRERVFIGVIRGFATTEGVDFAALDHKELKTFIEILQKKYRVLLREARSNEIALRRDRKAFVARSKR